MYFSLQIPKLNALYRQFAESAPVREPLFSKYLNDILTAFLLYSPSAVKTCERVRSMEATFAYIRQLLNNE